MTPALLVPRLDREGRGELYVADKRHAGIRQGDRRRNADKCRQ